MIPFFLLQMSLENDDKRARTRSKSIRGEWDTGLGRPQLPALSLFQTGFGFSSPDLTPQVILTIPVPSPLKFV